MPPVGREALAGQCASIGVPKLYTSCQECGLRTFRSHCLVANSPSSADEKTHSTFIQRKDSGMTSESVNYARLRLVNQRLEKMTIVEGNQFIKAWLDAIIYHAFLWKNGIEHGDPSLWHLKYNPHRDCGVLMDFDLETVQGSQTHDTDNPANSAPSGTIPFMATELLDVGYWRGEIKRYYHHELEAFIWILLFVFVGYSKGQFDPNAPFITSWSQVFYMECASNKWAFWYGEWRRCPLKPGFQTHIKFFSLLISMLHAADSDSCRRSSKQQKPYSIFFHHQTSDRFLSRFVRLLRKRTVGLEVRVWVDRLLLHRPDFLDYNSFIADSFLYHIITTFP